MSKEFNFIVGTIVLFLVAAFLTAPQSIAKWFAEHITPTVIVVVILLWWVMSHKNTGGGNPVLQGFFVFGFVLAAAALFAGVITSRLQAQEYVKTQFCRSDTTFGRFVREYVCKPLGMQTEAQPNAQYDLHCLADAFNANRLKLPNLGCGSYTPEVANDPALYKAFEDCLARSIIEGLTENNQGSQLVQSCRLR